MIVLAYRKNKPKRRIPSDQADRLIKAHKAWLETLAAAKQSKGLDKNEPFGDEWQ